MVGARGAKEVEVLGERVGGRNLDSLCTDSRRIDGPSRYAAAIQVMRGNASSEIDRNNASRSTVGALSAFIPQREEKCNIEI